MATSNVKIHFVDKNGNPYPCKRLVISDGKTVLQFFNVTAIDETVPSEASYLFVWNSGEYDTMEQLGLRLNENETHSLTFTCLDITETVEQTESYLLLEEEGSEVELNTTWNENNKELTFEATYQQGKQFDFVTWIDTDLRRPENKVLTDLDFAERVGGGIDFSVCFPPNVNLTVYIDLWRTAPVTGKLKFESVTKEKILVDIRRASYKKHIIADTPEKFPSELTKLDNTPISSDYFYPQYAVEEGLYHLKATDLPDEFFPITLPLKVKQGACSILEYYPPKISELSNYTFHIGAEYYHNRAEVLSVTHSDNSIQAYVNAPGYIEYSIAYYGYFVFPSNTTIESIDIRLNDASTISLKENEDYIEETVKDFKIVTCRVSI
jgi:hypothetical protein